MTRDAKSSAAGGKTRIFIVDDHPMVRERLAELIKQQSDLAVCGGAGDVPQARDGIAAVNPDLLILDLSLNGAHGTDFIRELHTNYPKLPVLVLTMHDESLYAERALRAGARGYITKQEATARVLVAIRRVLSGELYVSEQMAALMLRRFVDGPQSPSTLPLHTLSDRELEVFRFIGKGQGTRQIAKQLNLSIKTVESYQARIRDKLGLPDSSRLQQEALLWVKVQEPP